jgi:hypothetical protein
MTARGVEAAARVQTSARERGPAPEPRPWLAVLAFSALGLVLLRGSFERFDHIGGKDWNAFVGQAQAELTIMRDYRQLPLWNPWRGGGQVAMAEPESMFFSPATPLAMLVGVVPAFKLLLLPTFVLGCLGMWALAGHLGLTGLARAVPALVLFGSSIFPLYVCSGFPNWLAGMALLPWLVLFHRRSVDDGRWIFAAAAAYAGLVFCGSIYQFVFFPLYLALDAACLVLSRRSTRPFLTAAAVVALGVGLAAVRVVPLLEVYGQFPRELPVTNRYLTPALVVRSLLGTEVPNLWYLWGPWVRDGEARVYWTEAGSYIGPPALVLAAAGAVLGARQSWPFVVAAVSFVWMALGSGTQPSLWDALHRLPVLGSMQAPSRLILLVTFALSVLAGHGFQAGERALAASARVPARLRRGLSLLALGATLGPMVVVNAPITADAFIVGRPPGLDGGTWFTPPRPRPPFVQVRVVQHPREFGGSLYTAVLRNQGNLISTTALPTCRGTRPHGAKDYRGEAYLASGSGTAVPTITPNDIRVRVEADRDDVLVINQCFFPGWRAEGGVSGPVFPGPGDVLAVRVPAGRHDVRLRYRPRSVAVGAGISALTWLGVLVTGWRARGRRAPQGRAQSISA